MSTCTSHDEWMDARGATKNAVAKRCQSGRDMSLAVMRHWSVGRIAASYRGSSSRCLLWPEKGKGDRTLGMAIKLVFISARCHLPGAPVCMQHWRSRTSGGVCCTLANKAFVLGLCCELQFPRMEISWRAQPCRTGRRVFLLPNSALSAGAWKGAVCWKLCKCWRPTLPIYQASGGHTRLSIQCDKLRRTAIPSGGGLLRLKLSIYEKCIKPSANPVSEVKDLFARL